MPTERIQIVVEERGTRVVQRRLRAVGSESRRAATGVQRLQGVLSLLGGTLVVRTLLRTADAFTQIQNRLRLVTRGTGELNAVTEELLQISNRTRSAFATNGELFNRLSLATRELGLSQRDVLEITESLNQAVIISGASAQEASAGLIQLSQGLASGALRGDELRSVLEQLPAVADVIAKQLGVTRGELRRLGQDGKITAETIVQAFQASREELAERFGTTVPTVGQAFQVLQNQVVAFIGRLNEGTGVTQFLNRALFFLGDNIETVARVLGAGGLVAAIFAVTGAVASLTAAIAANPIGALLVGITAGIALLTTFSDKLTLSSTRAGTFADVVRAGFEVATEFGRDLVQLYRDEVAPVIDAVARSFEDFFSGIGGNFSVISVVLEDLFGDFEFTLEGILRLTARVLDRFVGFWRGAIDAVKALFPNLGDVIRASFQGVVNSQIALVENLVRTVVSIAQSLGPVIERINSATLRQIGRLAGVANEVFAGNFLEALSLAADASVEFTSEFSSAFDGLPARIGENFERNSQTILLPRFKSVGTEGARAVVDAFTEGLTSFTVFEDLANNLFDRADQIAAARRANAPAREDVNLDDLPAGGGAPLDRSGPPAQLTELLEALRLEQELLRLTNSEREIQNDLLRIEDQLRRDGLKELLPAQREQIEVELRRLQQLELIAAAVDQVTGSTINLALAEEELIEQVLAGNITLEQARQAMRDLKAEALETGNTLGDGFQRGLISIQDTIANFSDQAESTLVNAFQGAEDALVDFVTTGKADFSALADSILADLTRLLARQALFQLIGLFNPGAGAVVAGSGLFGGARENGGPVSPGQSFLVGERGPELFTPSQPGNITPAGPTAAMMQQQPQAPPVVEVQVINVTDPNEVPGILASPAGERAVLNVIRRNRRALQELQ